MNMSYVLNFVLGLFGVVALGLTYTYIDHMEKVGCACAEHKYKGFVKTWSVIALFAVLLNMFAPVDLVDDLHEGLGQAYAFIASLFLIVHIVYVVVTLMYLDYLIKEKCKCSEDSRRELLYIWSIVRALVIVTGLLLSVIIPVSLTSVAAISRQSKNIISNTTNPVSGLRKIPKSLAKTFKKYK